ncbi:hypothetical protein LINPERHAP2_LOCUS25388 [Linum perenne]
MSFHLIDELALQAKKWLIQARVSRSWLTYTPNKPTPLRLDLILMGRKGNAIWTHIPNYLIHQFEKQLTEQKVYVFKNFKVSMAPKSYKPLPNQFIILFTSNTTVEEIGDIPCIPMYTFTFIKEAEMGGKLKHIINLSGSSYPIFIYTNNEAIIVTKFRVKLQVIDSTTEFELIIFDYEGQRFFNIDADKLYTESGETRTPPNHLMQLIDQQMKFQIKLPSYFCNSVTEYPVHRILEGTIEAVTPPADSPVQEQGELVRGNSSSQSLNSTITATEIPAQLLPINLNLENSNAKKTLGERKKTSIQGISTSDSEDQE